jgi:multidrug efflux pump subunit AcrA (membrane-fusion protein)
MTRKVIVGVMVLVLLAGVAGLAANTWRRQQDDAVPVVEGNISQLVVAIGRVEPGTEVVIANRIPGRIKAVLVREGDPVRIGQPVIRFDDDLLSRPSGRDVQGALDLPRFGGAQRQS